MDKNKSIKLLKLAITFYIASFMIINWADISWMFNYRTVSGLVADFFNPYPTINASSLDGYFYPNHNRGKTIVSADTSYTDKQSVIEIPSISIEAPIVFAKSTDAKSISKELEGGVVYYPGSVYPGQQGQIVVLGHSAPSGWPKVRYDWVFSDLEKLKVGDSILVHLNNKRYTYIVKETRIIKVGADVPSIDYSNSKNVLTLISCWPPGKDYQRIAVVAELVTAQSLSIDK